MASEGTHVTPNGPVTSDESVTSEAGTSHRFAARFPRFDAVAWIVTAVGAVLFTAYAIRQWDAFFSSSWDQGIFTQLAQRYANLETPIVDIKEPGFNLWGDHFHPVLLVTGIVFKIWPSGLSLLVLQALLFALSAEPITRVARARLGRLWGTLVGIAYLFSWGLASALSVQFHEYCFAVVFLAFGLSHWLEGRHRLALIELAAIVFVKEDLGLTVVAFGAVLIWMQWGRESAPAAAVTAREDRADLPAAQSQPDAVSSLPAVTSVATHESTSLNASASQFPARTYAFFRRTLHTREATTGLLCILWGFFWFVVSTFIILPLFNVYGTWNYTGNLSETQTDIPGILGWLTNFFGPGQKEVTALLLILASGVVGLRSPYIWLMLPTLVWRFAGNVTHYWGWGWHYSAILMPIASIALIDGVERLRGSTRLRSHWKKKAAAVGTCLALATSATMTFNGAIGTMLRGETIGGYSSQSSRDAAWGLVDTLGTGHNVCTDIWLMAYLVPGNTVYWEGTVNSGNSTAGLYYDPSTGTSTDGTRSGAQKAIDVVAASPQSAVMPFSPEQLTRWAAENFGGQWEITYSSEGFRIAQRIAE
ncbi:DUF2079 domain-containing protein [Actinobaculum sp. 352]|uniref:DUF2079 domain-containing protein n=1 Tax=Actinobaculum sp. 352 TaxID=2490946 RepID=UPI000F7E4654|nr:DUF2079 domain-containing protein [Actinobaculum sp. 352]RTE49877.1 DUF2079 domain-containing protein [Actinobaculum sp. 352]